MHGAPVLLWSVLGFFAIERAAELAINRRNSRELNKRGAIWHGRNDGLPMILAAQTVLFGGTLFEGTSAAWAGPHAWTWPALMLLLLAQVVRYWCIATLGWRWTIRIVTVPGAPRITSGPYRWFPHPNYAVVMAEAILLPLAFGAWVTLLVAAPLQLLALWRRVRLEERALGQAERAGTS